jgi:hypothetical protein
LAGPPEAIELDESGIVPSWTMGSFKLDLHVSEFAGTPRDFLKAMRQGQLEFIFVAKGDYNSYFLVVEPERTIHRAPEDSE